MADKVVDMCAIDEAVTATVVEDTRSGRRALHLRPRIPSQYYLHNQGTLKLSPSAASALQSLLARTPLVVDLKP